MKLLKLVFPIFYLVNVARAQNVGIGTISPNAMLHVKNGAVLFDSSIGSTPVSGPGTRMMWVPDKQAFRVGFVTGAEWDNVNIGPYSFAAGKNTKAINYGCSALGDATFSSGLSSLATGHNSYATGNYSTAMGDNSIASGSTSTALGSNATASGVSSTALGNGTASGNYSTAMGYNNVAKGGFSTALGASATASGYVSIAMGMAAEASGDYSIAAGYGVSSKYFGGFTAGLYNDSTNAVNSNGPNPLNRIFQIGNGTSSNLRSNALTILQNGNIGIRELNPTVPLNFAASLGDKISLYGNSNNYYGMGIQPLLMQLFTDVVAADIAFGYGSSQNFTENMRIKGNGEASIKGNLTVQNGKGIIRSNDGTQQKKLTITVSVNALISPGSSSTIDFTFPESFSNEPDVYVGNVASGVCCWAGVIMSVSNVTSTGGRLYVNNPRTSSTSPNFTVKIIAIGPQ